VQARAGNVVYAAFAAREGALVGLGASSSVPVALGLPSRAGVCASPNVKMSFPVALLAIVGLEMACVQCYPSRLQRITHVPVVWVAAVSKREAAIDRDEVSFLVDGQRQAVS
jgi:hypothetical protein